MRHAFPLLISRADSRRVLDLSFNNIRTIPDALQTLPSLKTVYFVQNRISKISGLENLTNLTSIELGGNKIRVRFLFRLMMSD